MNKESNGVLTKEEEVFTEDKFDDRYKRLFQAVSNCNGYPSLEDLRAIVEIVKEDIIKNDKNNY